MPEAIPATIRIMPTSPRIAWILASVLALAAFLFAGDAWRSGGSSPAIYLLVFGLPAIVFGLLALLTQARSLELSNATLCESTWHGQRIFHLEGIVGVSLRVSVRGRIVTRQLILWSADQQEHAQIDITDYPIAHIRRLLGQILVQSPHVTLDRELKRYLKLIST